MRLASLGHAVFAMAMIFLGVLGLIDRNFAAVWQPVPVDVPAHQVLGLLCASLTLACGLGLLWKRTIAAAAGVLLIYLALWCLMMNVPDILRAHAAIGSWYGCAEAAVMVAAAWVLCAQNSHSQLRIAGNRTLFSLVVSDRGIRIARRLYALTLIYFGVGHFVYLKQTAADVPSWLPLHVAWAYVTGGAFILAGLAVLVGVYARLASALVALQIGLFVILVWIPIITAAGSKSAFQWSETVISAALAAAAWMLAESYRSTP